MNDERFDRLTKAVAHPVSRRTAFKAMVGAALGGVLLQFDGGRALAKGCKDVGDSCEKADQCCSGVCVTNGDKKGVCGCPDRTVLCPSTGQCVGQCCRPQTFDPKTCTCMCPNGQQFCPQRNGPGQCCPPPLVCSPTDAGCVCPPTTCPSGTTLDPMTCKCTCTNGGQPCGSGGAIICCAPPKTCNPAAGCVCADTTPCPNGGTRDPNTCMCSSTCPSGQQPCTTPSGAQICCGPNSSCGGSGSNGCVCSPGYADCNNNPSDGCETNISSNPQNCGTCGNVCSSNNGTPTCQNGTCGITCNQGYANCDNNPANGCEVNITSDPHNCGSCGNQCPSGANGSSVCQNGQCGIICSPGFANCDGNPSNGCEVNTSSDPNNCGACGNRCPPAANGTPICQGGACAILCNAGFQHCSNNPSDGCETNTNTDSNNCGACGHFCPNATPHCNAGVCQ